MPSLVAEIGDCIERHLIKIGMLVVGATSKGVSQDQQGSAPGRQCPLCGGFSVISRDGCDKCLSCDYQRCGG